MSKYKLTYFNSKGRAEVCRLIFAQAGVEYEDIRVDREEWVKLKPNTPTGMLPVLEVDGKQLVGSGVLDRFLGERLGFAGSNDIENAELAGIADVVRDFVLIVTVVFFEKDKGKKAELIEKLEREDIPKYWGTIEGMCRKNGSTLGWVYGDNPTYVDFYIFHVSEHLLTVIPTFMENFPRLSKLNAAVEALPRVAEWLEKRPKTEH
jgi:glutathione S-transferase